MTTLTDHDYETGLSNGGTLHLCKAHGGWLFTFRDAEQHKTLEAKLPYASSPVSDWGPDTPLNRSPFGVVSVAEDLVQWVRENPALLRPL